MALHQLAEYAQAVGWHAYIPAATTRDRQDHAAQECYVELFTRRQRTEASMMVKAALFTPSRWVKAARGESTAYAETSLA